MEKAGLPTLLPAAGRPRRDWRAPAVCAGLAVLTFAVFAQTTGFQFVNYDDNDYVYNNPMVARGLSRPGVDWAFGGAHAHNWHPLTWLSHMLDCQIYGLNPAGHHLTNVLLHTATVVILFLLLRQMSGALWRSAFVAAIFAVHPLRAESVAWVAERKDVLSGLFFVLTIAVYVRHVREPRNGLLAHAVFLLLALGLMSKPMLVTTPLVLLLLDYWPLQRSEPLARLIFEKLPLIALSIAAGVITLLAQHGAIQSLESFSPAHRLANAPVACVTYLAQMIWPAGLAAFYPAKPIALGEGGLALMALTAVSVLVMRQRVARPWLAVGWGWYLIMLLPVLGIIQVGGQAHADRYTYLPQIGICLALTWWVADLPIKSVTLAVGASAFLVLYAVWGVNQVSYWKNSEVLWEHALSCTTDNDVAHNHLGNYLMQHGDLENAIAHFQRVLGFKTNNVEASYNLGLAFGQLGRSSEAVASYRRALQQNPGFAEAHCNLGNDLLRLGRTNEAVAEYQEAIRLQPGDVDAHYNLGLVWLQEGKVAGAVAENQAAISINARNADARYQLALGLQQEGRFNEAIAQLRLALKIRPDDPVLLKKLAELESHR